MGCGAGASGMPRPTNIDGLPTWTVGRDRCVPPLAGTFHFPRADGFHPVGRGLAPAAGMHQRTSKSQGLASLTAPDRVRCGRVRDAAPYEHRRTTDVDCRAGPMCPAAGRHVPFSAGRWVPPRRAGACPRRRWGIPGTLLVDGPRRPPRGGGGADHGPWPGIAPSADGALGRWGISPAAAGGCFAPCAARVFRPLRRATKGSAFGNRDLGNAPPVGKRCRRGILCQSKAQLCSHTGCMARSWAAAMAQKARRHPQTHRW